MPIHDWTRVLPGVCHDFHIAWIVQLQRALNTGLLPADYYVMAEQMAGEVGPDVLALHHPSESADGGSDDGGEEHGGGLLLATAPPKASIG